MIAHADSTSVGDELIVDIESENGSEHPVTTATDTATMIDVAIEPKIEDSKNVKVVKQHQTKELITKHCSENSSLKKQLKHQQQQQHQQQQKHLKQINEEARYLKEFPKHNWLLERLKTEKKLESDEIERIENTIHEKQRQQRAVEATDESNVLSVKKSSLDKKSKNHLKLDLNNNKINNNNNNNNIVVEKPTKTLFKTLSTMHDYVHSTTDQIKILTRTTSVESLATVSNNNNNNNNNINNKIFLLECPSQFTTAARPKTLTISSCKKEKSISKTMPTTPKLKLSENHTEQKRDRRLSPPQVFSPSISPPAGLYMPPSPFALRTPPSPLWERNIKTPTSPFIENATAPKSPFVESYTGPKSPYVENIMTPKSPFVESFTRSKSPYTENITKPKSPFVENFTGPKSPYAMTPKSPLLEKTRTPPSPFLTEKATPPKSATSPLLENTRTRIYKPEDIQRCLRNVSPVEHMKFVYHTQQPQHPQQQHQRPIYKKTTETRIYPVINEEDEAMSNDRIERTQYAQPHHPHHQKHRYYSTRYEQEGYDEDHIAGSSASLSSPIQMCRRRQSQHRYRLHSEPFTNSSYHRIEEEINTHHRVIGSKRPLRMSSSDPSGHHREYNNESRIPAKKPRSPVPSVRRSAATPPSRSPDSKHRTSFPMMVDGGEVFYRKEEFFYTTPSSPVDHKVYRSAVKQSSGTHPVNNKSVTKKYGCDNCGQPANLLCSACKAVRYCSRKCQVN